MKEDNQVKNEQKPVEPQLANIATPKKKRKGFVLGLSIGIPLLLVLIGGGAWAMVWYNSPDKLFSDALNNLSSKDITAVKGTITAGSQDQSITAELAAKTDPSKNSEFSLKLSGDMGTAKIEDLLVGGVYDKDGNVYIKVENAKANLAKIMGATGTGDLDSTPYGKILEGIEGEWIKFSADDLSGLQQSTSSSSETCNLADLQKIASETNGRKEIIDAIVKSNYFKAEASTTKDIDGKSSQGYTLTVDKANEGALKDGLKNTEVFKKIEKCVTVPESEMSDSSSTPKVTIWVNKGERTINGISLEQNDSTSKVTADIELSTTPQTTTIPNDAKSFSEALQSLSGSFSSTSSM